MIKEIKTSIFLSLLLLNTNFLYSQWSGSGTENDPYQISTAAHLVALPNFVMADADETNNYLYKNTRNKFWKVMNDIDMNGVDYTPCGGWGNEFTPQGTMPFFVGTFDGNNKVIKNLTINKSGSGLVALFGFTQKATIKNVVLTNMSLSGTSFIGGIVGYAADENFISNCSFSGTITASGGKSEICIGGIVGYSVYSGSITSCQSHGTITTNQVNTYGGGIIGYLHSDGTLSECFSDVTLKNNGGGDLINIGGLVGRTDETSTVSRSYFMGTIIHTGSGSGAIGGCIGLDNGGNHSNLYSRANITATTGSPNVGGLIGVVSGTAISHSYAACKQLNASGNKGLFIGEMNSNPTVTNSYYANNIAGNPIGSGSTNGITSKSDVDLQTNAMVSTLNTGQPSAPWKKDASNANDGFPILSWQTVTAITPYTVSFDNNGGTGTMSSQTFTPSVSQNLSSNIFTRSGFTFANWNTTRNGSGTSYNNNQNITITANTTLYAQWNIAAATTYTVNFDNNDGTGTMSSQTFTQGVSQNLSNNIFTRSGFTFANWNTIRNGSGTSYNNNQNITITANTTLYAQWNSITITPPTLTANAVTAITQTTATLSGNVVAGSEPITERGFEWKLNSGSSWTTIVAETTESISTNLTELTANNKYDFRVYAKIAGVNQYSTTISFTTLATSVTAPTLTASAATAITQNAATINGHVIAGSEPITERGFEWKLNSAATFTKVATTSTSRNLTALTAETTYHFRVFATTTSGTFYSTTLNFTTTKNTTINKPTVVSKTATGITTNSAILNGTVTKGTETLTKIGFEWKLKSATTWTLVTVTTTGNNITHNLMGLKANTQYNVRTFATTTSTTYGSTLSFTTTPVVTPPTITTNDATLVTAISATLNGSITKGSQTITKKGFDWKLNTDTKWTTVTVTDTTKTISRKIIGLKENSKYDFRIFVTTASGTIYGSTLNFIASKTTTSVSLEKNTSIKIYPNPASNSVSISELEEYQEQVLQLVNISGQVVFTTIVKSSLINIDVSSFPRGLYFIKIGRYTQKIQIAI